jgi:hypothetical protein
MAKETYYTHKTEYNNKKWSRAVRGWCLKAPILKSPLCMPLCSRFIRTLTFSECALKLFLRYVLVSKETYNRPKETY